MASTRLCMAVLVVAGLGACGDDSGGVTADAGGGDATGGRDSSAADAMTRDSAPPDALLTSDGGACPNLVGSYGAVMTVGQGCGNLDTGAPQCIQGLNVCSIHFVSAPSGATGAVNGGASLTADGSFTGADLIFGTLQRFGCVGSWDAARNQLTATCGGVGASQSCTVTMVRSSASCP